MNRLVNALVRLPRAGPFARFVGARRTLLSSLRRCPPLSLDNAFSGRKAALLRLYGCPVDNDAADCERPHFYWFICKSYQGGSALEQLEQLPCLRPVRGAFLTGLKITALARELEEYQRKVAWQWRPETEGNEQAASHRSVLRFSGSGAFAATLPGDAQLST